MKKHFILLLVLPVLFLISFTAVVALAPVPSWDMTQGAPNSCSSTEGFNLPGLYLRVAAGTNVSEHGVLSAPGYPNLGYTNDNNFPGPYEGFTAFFVFSNGAYALPANTLLTLTVTTYYGTNQTGGVSYVDTITWNCTTGAVIETATSGACTNPMPSGATQRNVPLGAPAYYAADPGTLLSWQLPAGNWWVTQTSGDFAQVWIACQANMIWIPISALG